MDEKLGSAIEKRLEYIDQFQFRRASMAGKRKHVLTCILGGCASKDILVVLLGQIPSRRITKSVYRWQSKTLIDN